MNYYFSKKMNDEISDDISNANTNNNYTRNKTINNFASQNRITPLKQIGTKATDEIIINSKNSLNSKEENKSPRNMDFILFKARDSKSANAVTKIIASNIDEQNLKAKTDIGVDLDFEPYCGMNQYDLVIFSGDLNYRINMDKEEVKKLIKKIKNWKLY